MERRRYLERTAGALVGPGVLGTLAGCVGGDGAEGDADAGDGAGGDGDGAGGDGDGAGGDGDGAGGDGDAATLASHPSARGIGDEPSLGPDPEAATAVIVAFSDPACPTCRRFETGTFPTLKAEHVDSGEVAFVYRGIAVTYEWGKPAVQALEATYDRDADAFWGLKEHYYAEQPEFSADNVLDRTAGYLAEQTDVDADAVVADAREQRFDDRVQEDRQAALDAGIPRTPTFYLFHEGSFRTRVSGAKDTSVFAAALEL